MNDRVKQMSRYLRELEKMGADILDPRSLGSLTDEQRTWLRLKWGDLDLDHLTMYQDLVEIPLKSIKKEILSK